MYLNTWGHLALHPHRLRDLHLKKNQYHLAREGYLPISWEQIQEGLYDEIKQFTIVVINSRNGRMDVLGDDRKKKRFDYIMKTTLTSERVPQQSAAWFFLVA